MATGFLTRVEITDASGRVAIGEAKAAPGHVLQPFDDSDFEQKLRENVAPAFGAERAGKIIDMVWRLRDRDQLQALCDLLVLDDMKE